MVKRTWTDANTGRFYNADEAENHESITVEVSAASPIANRNGQSNGTISLNHLPAISRKVKACAACRKLKIRCIMDESGPPCKRCTTKDLSCVLNKSLQTLINERIPSTEILLHDLETVHANVQKILKTLGLPIQAPLQSSKHATAHTPVSIEPSDFNSSEEAGPSCDNSPKLLPEDDQGLPKVPIQSVYHLTRLSSLRSPESSETAREPTLPTDRKSSSLDDFISRGLLSVVDAERLFRTYTDRLDNFFYNVGAKYSILDELRGKSPILAAAILTVGAMHDPHGSQMYLVCNREFRRLMTESLFDRHLDWDQLRALCVASYWLNDSSWILSGIASRRVAGFNISSHLDRAVTEGNEESADCIRIWYLIYICDQHLATLFGRECTTREDVAVQNWELMAKSSTATCGDVRLLSQVALLSIIHDIRDLFGSDTTKPIPTIFLGRINGFARQLDHWLKHWTTAIPDSQQNFGSFPRKGAKFHFHFAKLYLYSHVFWGLRDSALSSRFLEAAQEAVASAISILSMIINDDDVREALVGLPCYVQSMTGFACMFLSKLTILHGDDMVERSMVVDLMSRLIAIYQATPVSKWHLVPLLAKGLEKMLVVLQQGSSGEVGTAVAPGATSAQTDLDHGFYNMGQTDMSMMSLDPYFLMTSTAVDGTDQGFASTDCLSFGVDLY